MKMWRTLGISLIVAFALLIAVGGSALALVEKLTIEELTARADSILIGEVTDITCYQEGEGNIYTLVTLAVEQTIKGEPGEEVVIKVLGGEVDGLQLWVSDTPSFQLGERTVVFLEEVDNALGVSGWYQGKFTVQDNRVVERNQSLTNFTADVCQVMKAQGITPKMSIEPTSEVLENPVEGKAVEPAKTVEFQVGWQNIITDGFEGEFPGTTWSRSGNPTWDKESSQKHAGTYSVWCAGSSYNPPSDYPNSMSAWMVYGPFSLEGATDAELNFYSWVKTEIDTDQFMYVASIDGSSYSGYQVSGDTGGWQYRSFDLTSVPTLGNLTGQSQVWIAFIFMSNGSITDEGAFVDDVVLRKYIAGGATPQITSISPALGSAGTGFEVTITGTDFGATLDSSTVTFWRKGSEYIEAPIVSWSDTEIVCQVPSGASSGDTSSGVRVTTPVGTSNDYPFTVTFSYSGQKWFGSNPMGEKIWINPNTADCIGEWQALIDAMQTWNDVDSANFYFEYGGLTTATDFGKNDYNEIMWVDYTPTGFPSGWIAVNLRWLNPSNTSEIIENDIAFNDLEFTWDTSGSPSLSQWDVQDIATHELGHSLCLLDLYGDADSEKTMYGFGDPGETKARTLEAEDIAGIQWIYPGTGTRGQYHISVTNNDDDDLTVSFKADTDAGYESYRQVDVLSGQTETSFWEVLSSGSHQVSIQWTDPDKGTPDEQTSASLSVPVEGDTEFSFTIPQYPSANTPPNAPTSLLCEGVTNPTGITDPTPEFSWTFSDPDGGDTQGAYQILVASTSGDPADMWDSGKVSGDASEVSYAGTTLAQNQTYYWKVKTWDNSDAEGSYCGEQQFTTGTSPSEVWVDDSWAGFIHGQLVLNGYFFGTDAFATIQDGIDAVAGSTVHVAAGTYYENITLKDGVEVLGAGAGVTTVQAANPDDHVFEVTADYVTITGFTIIGTDWPKSGIYLASGIHHCTISSNTVSNNWCGIYLWESYDNTISNNTASSNNRGIQLYYSCSNTISNNTLSNNGIGIDLWFSSNNNTVSNNTVSNNNDNIRLGYSSGNTISSNTVLNALYGYGIDLGYSSDSNTVSNNTVSNGERGITLDSSSSNIVSNNTVSNSDYGIYLRSSSLGSPSDDNTLTGNTVTNNNYGVYLKDPSSGNVIHFNNIVGNSSYGVYNGGATPVDATLNWWGDASGPGHGTNPSAGLGDAVSDDVDFMPWYATSTTTLDTEYVSVDHPSSSIIAYSDTIQGGIDAASAGDTINVQDGTYTENITLKDGVEVLGAGAEVTTIDGGGNGSVVTADGVGSGTKLDGFTITNGSASDGGGIYLNNSSSTISNCTFSGNSAIGYGGGGMHNRYSSPTVTNCTFSGNLANGNGGGMLNADNSSPTVTNCTFSGNSANAGGGMLNEYDSSPTMTNCTFSDNSATYGGGVHNFNYSSPTVTNCTFSGNSATYGGGGGGMHNENNSSPIVTNCILWDGGDEIYNDGTSTPTVSYCDVQGGYSGAGNIDADPLFVNPVVDDYHLQSGSPCIDTGDNTAVPVWLTTDFEGDPRIVDGDGDTVAVVDMGADEYLPPGPGLLKVETFPPIPTRIFVDGIPRNNWGLDWVKMPPGEYTLSFTDVPGYLAPEEIDVTYDPPGGVPVTQPLSQPIEILPDTTTQVNVNFVQLGNLRVETSPPVSTTVSLNGSPSDNWGFWVDLLPGDYYLSVTDVPSFATPVEIEVTYPGESPVSQPISQPIEVHPGGTTSVVIPFIQLGNLRVETYPVLPATIFVDGNPMNDWGFWVSLEVGDYTVSFQDMDMLGYPIPPPTVVTVTPGVTTYVIGNYETGQTIVNP